MTPSKRLAPLAILSCLAAVAVAAPVPKPSGKPISAKDAHLLRPVAEVPKRAYRILHGPERGELTLLDFNNAVEVVDDVNLRTRRKLAKGHHPTDFVLGAEGKLRAWTERGAAAYTVQGADGKPFTIKVGDHAGSAAFSPDGKLLAIGHTFWEPKREGAGYAEMKLFDASGKHLRTLARSGPGALRPVFSPDGKTLAVSNRNYETDLFEVATGKLLHRLGKRMTQEVAFSPDGKTLAAGYVDGTVGLWDVATGKQLHLKPSGCKEIYSVDWGLKGDVLASSGRDGKVVLWEPRTMKKLKELDGGFWVIQVRFTADGARLLSSSASDHGARNDRKVTVWAVPKGVGP